MPFGTGGHGFHRLRDEALRREQRALRRVRDRLSKLLAARDLLESRDGVNFRDALCEQRIALGLEDAEVRV